MVAIETPTGSRPGTLGPDGLTRLINCRAQDVGRSGKIRFPIYAAPGFTQYSTLPNGNGIRGILATEQTLYVVAGTRFFRVDTEGNATDIGGIPGTEPVYIERNRKTTTQIGVVTNGLYYVFENDVLTQQVGGNLPPPLDLSFIDGYFVFPILDGRFFISNLDEATTIDALDFASAEGKPDSLVRSFARKSELLLFGEETIEFWANTGAANFPFERLGGGYLELGLGEADSIAQLDDDVVFIANDDTVRMLVGYTPQIISNQSVQDSISRETGLIRGWSFNIGGNWFYVISGSTFTWVFDRNLALKVGVEDAWHERQSHTLTRWRAELFAQFAGNRIVGDYLNNTLYSLSETAYDENGTDLVSTIQFPITAYPDRLSLKALYLDYVPGVGLNSTDTHDQDPQVMVRLSRNGGESFGPAYFRSIGLQGQSRARTVVRRLGKTGEDGAVIEASVSAGVAKALTSAAADVTVL